MSITNAILYGPNIGGMKRRSFRSTYVQPIKRRVLKATVGTIRKISPRRQYRNFKQRILRNVGYYSTPMKLIRFARKHGIVSAVKLGMLRTIAGR